MMPKLRKHNYLARIGIFLIALALIVVTVSCAGDGGGPYTLTMAPNPSAGGTATDVTNGSPYAANTTVNITAAANPGYQFVSWSAPAGQFGNAAAATTTFTMPAQNVIVTANFAAFSGGNGTKEDPYQITDWYDLHEVRNYLDSYFILVNNLDSATAGYEELASPTANSGKGWEPIGAWHDPIDPIEAFTGTFDGQDYEVRDLFINRPDEIGVGLFCVVYQGGCIEDVGVVNASVAGNGAVGGLVGVNVCNVTDCYATGSVTGNGSVGGLVGGNIYGNLRNSYSTASVNGYEGIGGLVGQVMEGCIGNVTNCYATGSVTGNIYVGGLVGMNSHYSILNNSYSIGNVTGNTSVGGLVGMSDEECYVSNCYATGSVTGNTSVGGLVGSNEGYSVVYNSYSTGNVTGNWSVGGLVGANDGTSTVSNSFWDTETSGQATSDGGTGKNTTQMQNITTFSGATWDITTVGGTGERNSTYIWNIVNSVTYPFLSWQPV